jgi:uncharacterized protein YaeQ
MALKATVYKAHLNIADTDRGYYADHALTLACHPSETEERLMIRVLAFALFASEQLAFGRGLSAEDEADLWEKDLTGEIQRWIDLGQPDEARIRKACNRSRDTVVITYGARASEPWWEKIRASLDRFEHLRVIRIPAAACEALAAMADRAMNIQVTIQDGVAFVSCGDRNVEVQPVYWKGEAREQS